MLYGVIIAIVVLVGTLVYLVINTPIFTVQEQQVVIIERFGKFNRVSKSGFRFMWPFIEKKRKFKEASGEVEYVDLRERSVDLPAQTVITRDKVQLEVDSIAYYQVSDPGQAIYGVDNVISAVNNLIRTVLRDVIGNTNLDQLLSGREKINDQLKNQVSQASGNWGITISRVELQAVTPPASYAEAMRKVSEAELKKTAAIMEAQGKKEAALLEAEGEAARISKVYKAIHEGKPTQELLQIKYLEALQKIADGKATKVFMPFPAGGNDFLQQGIGMAAGMDAYMTQQRSDKQLELEDVDEEEDKTEVIAPPAPAAPAPEKEDMPRKRGLKLTDQSLMELQKAGLPREVLVPLKALEGKAMLRQSFITAIEKIVGGNKHPYYDVIMKQAKEIAFKSN